MTATPPDNAPQQPFEKVHGQITDESQSALRRYQSIVVGSTRLMYTIKYEVITGLLGNCPGAAGLWLREKLFPKLLGSSPSPVLGDN